MGEIRAKIILTNDGDRFLLERGEIGPESVRTVEAEGIADTGAVVNLLPQEIVEALGLKMLDKKIVVLADDRKVELDRAGTISLTVCGREIKTDCLVGPPGSTPLIGQVVMESLDLICDPVKRTLTPRPESPFLPTLALKTAAQGACPQRL